MVYMVRFISIFLLVLMVLFGLEMLEPVHVRVVEPFTGYIAALSAWLIMPFDDSVMAYGRVLRDGVDGFAVSIGSGCNGVEATIVLIAAVLAFPATWRQRLVVTVLGFLTILVWAWQCRESPMLQKLLKDSLRVK